MPIKTKNIYDRQVDGTCTIDGSFVVDNKGLLIVGLAAINDGWDNNCAISKNEEKQSPAVILSGQTHDSAVARIYLLDVQSGDTISYRTGGPAYLPSRAVCWAQLVTM
ncbi:MAG: hypothetical protein K2G55_18530 [Lachnospiraceae bacterium]|nr:hypothetical protein [Lachnospiraceae bacterium]